jgi:c-di-GMP-related signal transduction protein
VFFIGGYMTQSQPVNDIFVARQPILDARQQLVAYELLCRSSLNNEYDAADATSATLSVIRDAFLMIGSRLTRSKKAFINFNRELLQKRSAFHLQPESMVIEILEDVEADEEIIEACRELKEAGHTIALDDFDGRNEKAKALIDLADIIKVDFRSTTPAQRRAIVESGSNGKVRFLAEKVETMAEFEEAKEMGYEYFQGYFFSKPVVLSARNIPGGKLNYLRMLSEINRPEMDFRTLEVIIMQDPYFTYTLLNYMNSAYFGLQERISSIGQALIYLGERELRKWASLVTLTMLASDRPSEIVVTSLVRAKFCEGPAAPANMGSWSSELFLAGMFSMLDALIGRPIAELMESLNLSQEIRIALTVGGNRHSDVLDLALAYERANWEDVSVRAVELSIPEEVVPGVYRQSVEWADEIFENKTHGTVRAN